ncbi:MAG: DJ-1 family glyoxalase III [Prolixibacteraceae bacterium]
MTKILVHLAEGFEEMEALVPVDVWRRAGFNVVTISISNQLTVRGSHHISVVADQLFDASLYSQAEMIFLPGGIPGATHLDAHEGLREQLLSFHQQGKVLGAICAAPLILGHNQLLQGKMATCFPGFEKELYGATYSNSSVVTDGQVITGKGAGVALEFALEVVAHFKGKEFAEDIAKKMQVHEI